MTGEFPVLSERNLNKNETLKIGNVMFVQRVRLGEGLSQAGLCEYKSH